MKTIVDLFRVGVEYVRALPRLHPKSLWTLALLGLVGFNILIWGL